MALPVPRGRQLDVLALKASGHVVVLGTAGSGKTTVAALRAQILADPNGPYHGPTLLVTYNKSLVTYLRSIAREELENVQVETFHRFARGYLTARGLMGPDSIVKTEERLRCISEAMVLTGAAAVGKTCGYKFAVLKQLLVREFRVIAFVGLSLEEYAENAERRAEAVVEHLGTDLIYQTLLAYRMIRDVDGRRYDYDDMLTMAWETMRQDTTERRYRHIIIDEGQDFAPVMLRTLIAAVPDNGSVTFFGDVAQQIYGRESNWREAGFQVNKVELFEENRRNTPQIARLGMAVTAMPYYKSVPDMIVPTSPTDAGPLPTLVQYRDMNQELAKVCEQARNAVTTQNVAIICPTNALADAVMKRLETIKGSRAIRVDRDISHWRDEPRIYVTTFHNAKGLEFGAVILPFLSNEHFPDSWMVELYDEEEATTMAGSLLYVGITRSRRNLVLTYHGTLCSLLPDDRGAATSLYQRIIVP